jgi:hypothetical protein
MKNWTTFKEAVVDFTDKHWMTTSVMINYLQSLRLLCPTKEKSGVIVDKASMHTSTKLLEWKEETNKSKRPQIIYEFIEGG